MAQEWELDVRPLVQNSARVMVSGQEKRLSLESIEYIPWLSMNQEE